MGISAVLCGAEKLAPAEYWCPYSNCDIWITQCTHERPNLGFSIPEQEKNVWVPCQSNMHGARISCASVHMQRMVYRRKWLDGHLAPPPKSQFSGQGIHGWFHCVICEIRNWKTPPDRHLKCAFQMTHRDVIWHVHTVQNTIFRILIQNAHFELKLKLRTLLSCENSLCHWCGNEISISNHGTKWFMQGEC